MSSLKIIFTIIMLFVFSAPAYAISEHADAEQGFDVIKANKEASLLGLKLSNQNIDPDELRDGVARLDKLYHSAQTCIEDNQKKISVLEEILKRSQIDKSIAAQNPEFKYLEKRIAAYNKTASSCRIFVIRAQVALLNYKQELQKISTEKTLQRSAPLWHLFESLKYISLSSVDLAKMYYLSGLSYLKYNDGIVLLILVIIGSILGIYSRILLRLLLVNSSTARFRRIIKSINNFTIIILPSILMISCYFWLFSSNIEPTPLIKSLSNALLIYLLVLTLSKIVIISSPRLNIFSGLRYHQVKPIYSNLFVVITIIFIYYLISILFSGQNITPVFSDIAQSLFFSSLIISSAWFCWYFVSALCFSHAKNAIKIMLHTVIACAFAIILFIQLIGYHHLAIYIFTASIFTIATSFSTWVVLKIIDRVVHYLENNQSQVSQRLRYFLGVKPYKKVFEFSLIQFCLSVIIIGIYLILLLKIWKISVSFADQTYDALVNGIKFGSLGIIPSRILIALIVFSLSLLCGRFIATSVTRHHQFEGEKDTQVAVASIIKYAWIAATIVITLLVSGFDFTNLAIIAGALSVGIGLGMQHIVTNFVSGLILLLEKPIKPGDRIAIGNIEGFVRKIRARSTQITTPANEDVIIPNADLISQQVTNYMFRNRLWRVTCQVGVAYDSDIFLVEQLLLDIAHKHPEVIKDGQNKPTVCFKEFGASSLTFILWCVITDVNKKNQVLSDLNFSIYYSFKQNDIAIAYPQMEVRLKKDQ